MARTKLTVRRCLDLAHNRPKVKQPFKIKMILPEQKNSTNKKNGNVIKTINVRLKAVHFNDRWAKVF